MTGPVFRDFGVCRDAGGIYGKGRSGQAPVRTYTGHEENTPTRTMLRNFGRNRMKGTDVLFNSELEGIYHSLVLIFLAVLLVGYHGAPCCRLGGTLNVYRRILPARLIVILM